MQHICNLEFEAVQPCVDIVDLVKSFPTSVYLQKSASMKPRTSPQKFQVSFLHRQFIFILISHRFSSINRSSRRACKIKICDDQIYVSCCRILGSNSLRWQHGSDGWFRWLHGTVTRSSAPRLRAAFLIDSARSSVCKMFKTNTCSIILLCYLHCKAEMM